MGSGHGHGHAGERHLGQLAVSFFMIAGFFVVELTFGLLSGSLAPLSDAAHMSADVVALGAALVASRIATRPDTTGRRRFGSYRAGVFASGLSVLMMLGVAGYVVVTAVERVAAEEGVKTGPMLIVGALGLVVNVIALLLRGGASESLDVKGAYFEVVADTADSVGVIIAGLLIAATGRPEWDTVVALAIGTFVAVRVVALGRPVLAVLGQHAPEGMDVDAVTTTLGATDGVEDVHDPHLWTLTSGMHVATAHLLTASEQTVQPILDGARDLLRIPYAIDHATLQVETHADARCAKVG